MQILYLIGTLLIFVVFLLLPKTEKRQRILLWIVLSIVIFICYNIFVCLIFKMLNIKCTLLNLSIVNITLSILGIMKIIKDKKVQKYYVDVKDIIVPIIMLIIVLLVAFKEFGTSLDEVRYIMNDGATHYGIAKEFYEEQQLLNSYSQIDPLNFWNLGSFMPASYVNVGILFNVVSPIVNEVDFYKIYILLDIFMLYLAGLLMYLILSLKTRNKAMTVIAFIFAILYLLGYPLNNVQQGYSYLTIGLNIILAILIAVKLLEKEELKNIYNMLILAILNFGIFFSYYLFVPILYLAFFIWFVIKIKNKKEKIFTVKNILFLMFTLIIPAIYGIYYFVLINFVQGSEIAASNIGIEAVGEYINYGTNFLILIPLTFIYVFQNFRKNKIIVLEIIITLVFIVIMYIGKILGIVSEYYLMKLFSLAWIFFWISSYKAIEAMDLRKKSVKTFYIVYFIIVVALLIFQYRGILNPFDIYVNNYENTKMENALSYYKKELVMYYYSENLQQQEDNIDIYIHEANVGEVAWLYFLFGNPYFQYFLVFETEGTPLSDWLEYSDKEYYVFLSDNIDEEINENSEFYSICYQNPEGAILKKK